ncbi:MAG: hypothetical protein V3V08_03690 [Nannocystaceae bacterium]
MSAGSLQWGRIVIEAEGSLPAVSCAMTRPASMGPHRDRGGKYADLTYADLTYALQWGRIVIEAEGGANLTDATFRCALQWGRLVIEAEGHMGMGTGGEVGRFNGAAS